MLRKIICLMVMVVSVATQAQIIHGRRVRTSTDSLIHILTDTMTFNTNDTVFIGDATMADLLNPPAFHRPESELIHIMPRQRFCFNVVMDVELNFGGSSTRYAGLFINTTEGYIGFTRPRPAEADNVLFPEIEDFNFTVISYKLGKIYMYHNQKASGDEPIQHLVSTQNTEAHDYAPGNLLTSGPLYNKQQTHHFCDGQLRATLYKQEDLPTTWYLYNKDFEHRHSMPTGLQVQKYIGGWGIGLVQTSKGKFIIMQRTSGNMQVTIKHIQPTVQCFDPSQFKLMEQEFYQKTTDETNEEEAKINRDEGRIGDMDCCQAEARAIINFRRENVRLQRENNRVAQSGNLMQDRAAQKAMLSAMDPSRVVEGDILTLKENICMANCKGQTDKVACLRNSLSIMQAAKAQMEQLDGMHYNAVELIARKSRILMDAHQRAGGCN